MAKDGGTPSLPVMIGEKDGKTFYVIPMYGKGLWDAIWGFGSRPLLLADSGQCAAIIFSDVANPAGKCQIICVVEMLDNLPN